METEWTIRILLMVIGILSGFAVSQIAIVGKVRTHTVIIGMLKENVSEFVDLAKEIVKQNTILIAEIKAKKQ